MNSTMAEWSRSPLPLFISDTYSTVRAAGWVDDEGVKRLWGEGARFARWYDLPHFRRRILDKSPLLALDLYHIDNAAMVDPQCFPYFAMFEKVAGSR